MSSYHIDSEALLDFSNSSLSLIFSKLNQALKDSQEVYFLILDPNLCDGRYTGESIEIERREYICRSWRVWSDIAIELKCHLLTPKSYNNLQLLLGIKRLKSNSSFHNDTNKKYSPTSTFAKIQKNEEPNFYIPYLRALKRLKVEKVNSILDLGLYRGDELIPLFELGFRGDILGIDLEKEALLEAKRRFKESLKTITLDINDLPNIPKQRFDLIISIGTLQSPNIQLKPLIMHLVQERLNPQGSILLAWPNSRWIDGELIYGAKPKNYPFSELSLVIKDLFWIKKYLQQHRFRVVITGREYLFLEATKIKP